VRFYRHAETLALAPSDFDVVTAFPAAV
jgi:hypothetical protein